MAYTESDVINKIRNSKNPNMAMQIAIEIITDHLMQLESSPVQSDDPQQESCEVI